MRTFWDTQSVGHWIEHKTYERESVEQQGKLPDDFEWSSHSLEEAIYDFLKENYVSAENFKLRYTMETLKWAIDVPLGIENIWYKSKNIHKKIIGLISLTPFTMKLK
jgi:glycylpeptide N-tetradecanoyltransferase